jgi:pimeloyl-ACP methyl ester carboxylesterase
MPEASIEVVEGGGHLVWVDRPDACARAVDGFLRDHETAASEPVRRAS